MGLDLHRNFMVLSSLESLHSTENDDVQNRYDNLYFMDLNSWITITNVNTRSGTLTALAKLYEPGCLIHQEQAKLMLVIQFINMEQRI